MYSSYTEALRHIFDNDTSGLVRSDKMTVRYRCGQCNELPPVRIFSYLSIKGDLCVRYIFIGRYVVAIAREKEHALKREKVEGCRQK